MAVFVVGSFVAYSKLPARQDINLRPLVLAAAVACVPLTLVVNAWEFRLSTNLLGPRVPFAAALRVSVLASAANSLPLPGAVVVKTRALANLGHSYRRAIIATVAIGVAWVAVAALVAGTLVLRGGQATLGVLLLAAGFAGSLLSFAMLSTHLGLRPAIAAARAVALIESLSVGLAVTRIYLVANGVGFDVSAAQAGAMAVAAIVASAVGIFPGGLGLREVLSAGIAGATSLAASVGLLTAAVDRLMLTLTLALVTGGLLIARHGPPPDTVSPTSIPDRPPDPLSTRHGAA